MIQTETPKERQQEICVDGQVDFVTGTLPNHNFEKKLGCQSYSQCYSSSSLY